MQIHPLKRTHSCQELGGRFHIDNGEHKVQLLKCIHHWPGAGPSNSSESSTNNGNLMKKWIFSLPLGLVKHKREGQYQILYKENMLNTSSTVRTSGKKTEVCRALQILAIMAYCYKLVKTIATYYEQLAKMKLLKNYACVLHATKKPPKLFWGRTNETFCKIYASNKKPQTI